MKQKGTKNNRTKSNKSNKLNKTKRIYTNDDYNSGDGMLTSVWGPSIWHFLHTMSFNYPVQPTIKNKKAHINFINSLQHILPCKYCRVNLSNNLKKFPVTNKHLANRETFSKYIYDLHEVVNRMLKKNSNLTYDEVRERYEHFRARCTEEKPKIFDFKTIRKTRKNNGEKGCTEPLYGKKSKCIIKIVPQENKSASFQMDKKCVKKRLT